MQAEVKSKWESDRLWKQFSGYNRGDAQGHSRS